MEGRTKLARQYLRSIATKAAFNNLAEELLLSEQEEQVLRSIYLRGKSQEFLSCEMGYSIQTIRLLHKKVLLKVDCLLNSSPKNI